MKRNAIPKSDVLSTARRIAEEYREHDLTLTVRQMYYQFVRRYPDEYPSAVETYNRIKDILSEARYRGTFPIDMIEDRGREVRPGSFLLNNTNVDVALDRCVQELETWPGYLQTSRWFNQPRHVSVWVEKDALSGVFEAPCDDLEVSWFACKGYPSVSALWEYLTALRRANSIHDYGFKEAVILYFGDHDPDGLEIPEAAARGLDTLKQTYGVLSQVPIRFERVALSLEQIEEHNAPPFPAKETSSRFKKYREKTGLQDAWELDALEPLVLRDLITSSVDKLFSEHVWQENQVRVKRAREELVERVKQPGWFDTAVRGLRAY